MTRASRLSIQLRSNKEDPALPPCPADVATRSPGQSTRARISLHSKAGARIQSIQYPKNPALDKRCPRSRLICECNSYRTDFNSLIWQPCTKHESNKTSESMLCVAKEFLIGTR